MTNSSRTRSALTWIGVVAWVLCPLLVITIALVGDRSASFDSETPTWAPVEEAAETKTSPVALVLSWAARPELVAPAWSGVVQSVLVAPGQSVKNGTPIAAVSGVTRIAWATPGAFYRPLAVGDSGPDVAWLGDLLVAKGFPASATDKFDRATLSAVRALAAELGVPDASRTQAFDPGWVVFLPSKSVRLESITVRAGQQAPAAGSTFAIGAARLRGAVVAESDAAGTPAVPLAEDDAERRYQEALANPTIEVATHDLLSYAELELQVEGSSNSLNAESLTALSKVLTPGAAAVPATLRSSVGTGAWVVPAASISRVGNGTQAVCVVRGQQATVVQVEVVSGRSDAAVDGLLRSADRVRVPGPTTAQPCRSN